MNIKSLRFQLIMYGLGLVIIPFAFYGGFFVNIELLIFGMIFSLIYIPIFYFTWAKYRALKQNEIYIPTRAIMSPQFYVPFGLMVISIFLGSLYIGLFHHTYFLYIDGAIIGASIFLYYHFKLLFSKKNEFTATKTRKFVASVLMDLYYMHGVDVFDPHNHAELFGHPLSLELGKKRHPLGNADHLYLVHGQAFDFYIAVKDCPEHKIIFILLYRDWYRLFWNRFNIFLEPDFYTNSQAFDLYLDQRYFPKTKDYVYSDKERGVRIHITEADGMFYCTPEVFLYKPYLAYIGCDERYAKWMDGSHMLETIQGFGKMEYALEEAPTILEHAIELVYNGHFNMDHQE